MRIAYDHGAFSIFGAVRASAWAHRADTRCVSWTTADWRVVPLRQHQESALLAWMDAKRGLLALPAVADRSAIACGAMAACGVPTLCLVPTPAHVAKWRREIERWYRGTVGCLGHGRDTLEAITVATFEAAHRQLPRVGRRFGMVVVDPVGPVMNDSARAVVEMCAAPRRLGLTSWAPRAARPGAAQPAIGRRIGGVLPPRTRSDLAGSSDVVVLDLQLTPQEQAKYEQALARFRALFMRHRSLHRDAPFRELVAVAAHTGEGRDALHAFEESRRLTNYSAAKRTALHALIKRHRNSSVLVVGADDETACRLQRDLASHPNAMRTAADAPCRVSSACALDPGGHGVPAEVAIIVSGGRESLARVSRDVQSASDRRHLIYELALADTHEERALLARCQSRAATHNKPVANV